MNGSPIQTTKTYEAIIQRLLEGIQSEEFPPGSKLPSVRQLSVDWQVGQAAVREALSALKAMNLITSRQGEGTFVNPATENQVALSLRFGNLMSAAEIQSLLELRVILESGAVRLAAVRRTNAELELLQDILERMETDLTMADVGEQADWKFHHELTKAAKNPYLTTLMESVGEQIQSALLSSRLNLYRIEGEPERLLQQHRSIFQAVANQDVEVSATALSEHLHHVESQLERIHKTPDGLNQTTKEGS